MKHLTTVARFNCPVCSQLATATVNVPEVDWSIEPLRDSLSQDDVEMECDHCKSIFGIHVQNSPAGCFIEIEEHPKVKVTAEAALFSSGGPDDGYWLNANTPDSPYDVFHSTCHHLGDLLAEYGDGGRGVLPWSGLIINQMVFAAAVSALEAYLGDTLVTAVFSNSASMQQLIERDSELSKTKVSLDDVLKNPDVVSDRVRAYLQALLYHNLPKIKVIYEIALGVDIFPDPLLKERLHRAVQLRHDVVHRNGKSTDGKDQQFPSAFVDQTIGDVRAFVTHVENSIQVINEA